MPHYIYESRVLKKIAVGGLVAGVDEAGRGPLAGPVVAAAVILQKGKVPKGLNDSKQLDAETARGTLLAHHVQRHRSRSRRSHGR